MGSGDCKRCNAVAVAVAVPDNQQQQSKGQKKQKGGRMKVLKKFKRKLGLVSRNSSATSATSHQTPGGSNNLPPLLFHSVHGENIRISRDGSVARRVESFCKGVAFSARPIRPGERVHLRFVEVAANWSGVLRFGFTAANPSCLRFSLPKYACPDLTNKPGHWAKALPERFCAQGAVLSYHVTTAGDVHFAVDGEDKGVFFGGVETRGPLWALVDVYGNSTAVEFVDPRRQLNNSRESRDSSAVDRITYPMQQLQVQDNSSRPQPTPTDHQPDLSLPLLRYQPANLTYQPMPLHRTKGRNVRFTNSTRSVACRTDTEICQGYVFTARPLQLGERIVVQILTTEPMFQGCLGLGLTSCDPSTLQSGDLPEDSNFLLDRPEYWVLSRDFSRNLNKGDEISFCISLSGEVQISRNGGAPLVVIHVDQTLRLWAFFDIYGSTQRIRVLSSTTNNNIMSPVRNHVEPNSTRRIISPTTSESINSLNTQSEMNRRNPSAARLCYTPADVQVQQVPNGGAVLSVILPPTHANIINQQAVNGHGYGQNSHGGSPISPVPSGANGTMISSCSSTYVEPVSCEPTTPTTFPSWPTTDTTHRPHPAAGTECTICYENSVDAVLYMCGHMCMCYECALQQWRGKGGGHCPLCRAVIRDVIRTYKA